MRVLSPLILSLTLATAASAVTITGGTSCPTSTTTDTIAAVSMTFTRDGAGVITGGSAIGFCAPPSMTFADVLAILKDGNICVCPKQSGTGKDLWCKATATGEDSTTWGSCVKSSRP